MPLSFVYRLVRRVIEVLSVHRMDAVARTQRSWCSVTRWRSFAARSPGLGSPGRTGRSSPPWPDWSRARAGLRSSSRQRRSCADIAPSCAALDLPAPPSRPANPPRRNPGPHRAPVDGEPALGLSAHRRGAETARRHGPRAASPTSFDATASPQHLGEPGQPGHSFSAPRRRACWQPPSLP